MLANQPDEKGYFGQFGGCYAPEVLMQYMLDVGKAYSHYKLDANFQSEFTTLLNNEAGRETPLLLAENLSRHAGGAQIFLKREDLTRTGSHHINAALGQALLAKKMGKTLLITETSTGLHGLAVAQAAAILGMDCHVLMGATDASRQVGTVEKMRALGAEVSLIETGAGSLLAANEATTRAWLGAINNGFYVVNSVIGPNPYPTMVRDFQSIIGQEVKQQILSANGRLPDHLVASVGGGANAMGLFTPFLETDIPMTGVRALKDPGRLGVFQGVKTLMQQDENGQLLNINSLAVGLQSCLTGPEPSFLHSEGRLAYATVSDEEVIQAYELSTQLESITPALESCYAIAYGLKLAANLSPKNSIVINLSGRGEKDADQISAINK